MCNLHRYPLHPVWAYAGFFHLRFVCDAAGSPGPRLEEAGPRGSLTSGQVCISQEPIPARASPTTSPQGTQTLNKPTFTAGGSPWPLGAARIHTRDYQLEMQDRAFIHGEVLGPLTQIVGSQVHRAPLFLFIRVSYTPFLEPGSPVQESVDGEGVVTHRVQTYCLQGLFTQLSPGEIPQ